jgi:tricorn protease
MKVALLAVAALVGAGLCHAQSEPGPLLLQQPTISRTQIVFVYAGELWRVDRDGGAARHLTTGVGIQSDPHFSPDGRWIAFTGNYGGNPDVYVISADGGEPRRLTYHPGYDQALGWTPDGTRVLFASDRSAFANYVMNLYTISVQGGLPQMLPFPYAFEGAYSPDETEIAYCPLPPPDPTWSHYRGGEEPKIWLAKLSDWSYEEIPRGNWNEMDPMWLGGKLYFLSDEKGPFTLFEYDPGTGKTRQALPNEGLPIKEASAGPDAIVYSQFGSIHIFDPSSGREHPVRIGVAGEFPQLLPHVESVQNHISNVNISPTGARVAFESHGEVLTVSPERGDIRNITNSPGVADRDPAWSPDGKSIAYFSDESGEYALQIRDQSGLGPVRKLNLGSPPSFFYDPQWSPDSKKIAYTDKRLNVWYIDLAKGRPFRIDADVYDTPDRALSPSWSPDSEWIAYTKLLRNHLRAVFVYSLATGRSTQIMDGLSDARTAVWDRNGKWLYFTSSTDAGPTTGWIDMSSYPFTVTRNVYLVVLSTDDPSPLAPPGDLEGKIETSSPAALPVAVKSPAPPRTPKVRIDFANISRRILALPVPAADYFGIESGKTGELFLVAVENEKHFIPPPLAVTKFDLRTRKTTPVISGVIGFHVSLNGEEALYRSPLDQWGIGSTAGPIKLTDGLLKLGGMKVYVDPRAEWKQMYHEVWRIERDFFYSRNWNGLDLAKTEAEYAKYLPGLATREDENYLFNQMLSNLNASHITVRGGEVPAMPRVAVGLLGADYRIENGRYRIVRVLKGESWNPSPRAPLTQPGINIVAGAYLLAVDGRDLRASDNVYSYFLDKAGKPVVLRVGPNPDGRGARDLTVTTVPTEFLLRSRDWIAHNRQLVDRLSGGKLAYVYLPDTRGAGYDSFNRDYMAQVDKQGAIIDERFNAGGQMANYVIDVMQRKLSNYWQTQDGAVFTTPTDAIFGPKVMLINQFVGSGGDWLAWAFMSAGLGPTIGERTWGGLMGVYGTLQLIDGGSVTVPRAAFFTPKGTWDVENQGVSPDIPIELDPKGWREGRDVQLEKAVAVALDELKRHPLPRPQVPVMPDYSRYAH